MAWTRESEVAVSQDGAIALQPGDSVILQHPCQKKNKERYRVKTTGEQAWWADKEDFLEEAVIQLNLLRLT